MYFTLKDRGAQIKAVMFQSSVRYAAIQTGGRPARDRARTLSVYEPEGEYQLVCEHMEPHGLGALQLAFEQLKKRLQAEGLFDAARKRPLPALPAKIGIVTSLDGAALRDILKVLGPPLPERPGGHPPRPRAGRGGRVGHRAGPARRSRRCRASKS